MKFFNEISKSHTLMNICEVSLYLRIPLKTVYRFAKQGKIKGVKIGKHWRFLKQDIDYYLQYGKYKSVSPNLPKSIEQRSCPRINCSLPCYIKILIPFKKEINTQASIINISESGFFLENNNSELFVKIRNDDPLTLSFNIKNENRLEIDGRVLRIQNNGVAGKFRNISKYVRNEIAKYVG